ncbi:MAG: RHS repeat-associated core domain-containing protein, partial [Clostridiaceae bacterium]
GAETFHYTYDGNGAPFSMTYNGSEYFYLTNLQGDVTGLANAAGATVVSYTYDSWGKLITTTGSLATTLGVKNPYRYRGYRYDTETGLYYLQSRYYNPEIGRFINADNIENVDNINLLTSNLFAYCLNNPINMSDGDGKAAVFMQNLSYYGESYVIPVMNKLLAAITGIVVGIKLSSNARASINERARSIVKTKNDPPRYVRLYRAMSIAEKEKLFKLGRFTSSPRFMEYKWFSVSKSGARHFGITSKVPYVIVQITIKESALRWAQSYHPNLDGVGPAYCFDILTLTRSVISFSIVE